MKKTLLCASMLMAACGAHAQLASDNFEIVPAANNTVYFSVYADGEYLPIVWGLDTAWPHEGNIVRGTRFMGAQTIDVVRVSFQPWDFIDGWVLPARMQENLKERLRLISLIKGEGGVQVVLNNDGPVEEMDSRYFDAAHSEEAAKAYADVIYTTLLSCQDAGWEVITASPLNEPDCYWNGQGSKEDFLAISKVLRTYPQFADGSIRLSGGNTLNCDSALTWYQFLYDYVDEGNTHQLAGDFDHYADFFRIVREDGKYATADELHNVMEAMVGVEYGMQTGIWWGTAELARGEFCKASNGRRLAYAENRPNWTAASVYRNPEGGIQAFVGTSERQAKPDSYRFVSTDRDVFYNGYGPQREYYVATPGGNGYQDGQTNAECVVDITWGEDVSPVIDGNYLLMNKMSEKVMAISGSTDNFAEPKQFAQNSDLAMLWQVKPVPNNIGGDFSYWTIKLADKTNMKLDINNFTLAEGGSIILYDGGEGDNEQWYLRYAGDGYFRIFSRYSDLCLEVSEDSNADGVLILQASESENPRQLWRFIPNGVDCETEAPLAPTALAATSHYASIHLSWEPSLSADVASYTVLRADAGTDEYSIIARGIPGCEFIDNNIDPWKTYSYKVKAVDFACNSSDWTSAVEATPAEGHAMVMRLMLNKSITDETTNHFDAKSQESARYGSGYQEGTYALNIASGRKLKLHHTAFHQGEATVAMWVKPRDIVKNQTLLDIAKDVDHRLWLGTNDASNMTLMMHNGEEIQNIGDEKLAEDEWTHIALVIRKDYVGFYVNGELAAEDAAGFGLSLGDLDPITCYLGGCVSTKTEGYVGFVQDLRVYNHCLTEDELKNAMDVTTSIAAVNTDAAEIGVEYYNLQGQKINNPISGVYLKCIIYANGTSMVQKIVK